MFTVRLGTTTHVHLHRTLENDSILLQVGALSGKQLLVKLGGDGLKLVKRFLKVTIYPTVVYAPINASHSYTTVTSSVLRIRKR